MVGIGDVVARRYKVERILGQSGKGYVVAARHEQLDQRVAIKILWPDLCESEDAVARFLGEARASVPLQGEHVARVLDVGALDDGAPYMVMEFLEGCDLAAELDERVALPATEAVDYVLQACEALAEAHALGIVHRDLKPANLFRTRRSDGSALIKVLDFGISKGSPNDGEGPSRRHLAATQGSSGSPYYMSPELMRGAEAVDTRSDIWSLGAILFELLTGYPPRVSDDPTSLVLAAAMAEDPRGLAPAGLQQVISRCLEREPGRRYADVIELADALQVYASNGPAAVARILAIVRGVNGRALRDVQSESRACMPTLESPRAQVEIRDVRRHAARGRWRGFASSTRARWTTVLIGATVLVGAALLVRNYVARSPVAYSFVASSTAPVDDPPTVARSVVTSSGRSQASCDQDAAINLAAVDAPAIAGGKPASPGEVVIETPRPIRVDAKRHWPLKTPAERSAAPPTTSVSGAPAVDSEIDPLDGRF